jgi:tetratricopeptide (TPR) repeat protein
MGPWDDLERIFTEALSHDRGYVPHLGGRADVRHLRARRRASRGEDPLPDFAAAEADLTAALAINDQYRSAWSERGHIRVTRAVYLMSVGKDPTADFAAAEQDFREALARAGKPHAATLRRRAMVGANRGRHRESLGESPLADYASAERDLDDSVRLEPDSSFAAWAERGALRVRRGRFRQRRGEEFSEDFRAAAVDLDEALRRRRDHGPAWQTRGLLRLQTGQVEEACSDLEEATRLEPWNWQAWVHRADAAGARARLLEARPEKELARKAYAEAVGFLERAVQADPSRTAFLSPALEAARVKAR